MLRDVDSLGGFFAVSTGRAAGVGPSWRPLTDLLGGGAPGPDGPLAGRIDEVAAGLGASRRVAASLLQNSVAARFVSVLLAAAVEHRVLPDLPHGRLHWRRWSGGPMPLWIDDPAGSPLGAPEDPATADAVTRALVDVHLGPLAAAVRSVVSVPERTLWGNAASQLHGAVRVLGTQRPAALAPATALVRSVLGRRPFAGLGELLDEPSHPTGLGFRRRSCCLYYRVPGGGYCADCVLVGR